MSFNNQTKISANFISGLIVSTCTTAMLFGCGKTEAETSSTGSSLDGDWVATCQSSDNGYERQTSSFSGGMDLPGFRGAI